MTQQVRTEGYLLKKGENRHNWKRRWFKAIPANQTLEYFDSPEQVRGSCSRNASDLTAGPAFSSLKMLRRARGLSCSAPKSVGPLTLSTRTTSLWSRTTAPGACISCAQTTGQRCRSG
jgi:hypothetical protein